MSNVMKHKDVVTLAAEYLRLKDVIKRAKRLSSGAKRFDLVASSIDSILAEVDDLMREQPKGIPGDRYSSGHRDSQCWAKIYGETKAIAEAKRDDYFRDYPTFGYSTNVITSKWVTDDPAHDPYYFIHIVRIHSCD